MNKTILIIAGVIFLGIVVAALAFTTFFKNPTIEVSTNTTSPFYTIKYAQVKYPNEVLTPGQIQTNDLNIICYHYYDQLLVEVPDDVVKKVYAKYMIDNPGYKQFEIDHFIPLALGGSNNIENLWPQPKTTPGYKEKDYVQLYLRDQVCNHGMNLTEARKQITGDWYSLFLKVHGKDGD